MSATQHYSTISCNSYSAYFDINGYGESSGIAPSRTKTQKRGMALSLLSAYNRSMRLYVFCISCGNDGMGLFITGSSFTIDQLFNVALPKLKPAAFAQESRLIYRLNLASLHQVIKCLSANSKSSQNLLSRQQSLFTHSNLFSLIIFFTRYTNYTTLTKHESMGIMWLDNNYNLDIDQEQKIKASNSLNIVTAALESPSGYQSSDDSISTSCRLIAHCTQSGQNLQGVQSDEVYKRASRGGVWRCIQ